MKNIQELYLGKNKSQKSFTFIELLVFISVVSFIVAISVIQLNNMHERERDSERLQELAGVLVKMAGPLVILAQKMDSRY